MLVSLTVTGPLLMTIESVEPLVALSTTVVVPALRSKVWPLWSGSTTTLVRVRLPVLRVLVNVQSTLVPAGTLTVPLVTVTVSSSLVSMQVSEVV